MYRLFTLLILIIATFHLQAQEWVNCTNGDHINDIAVNNDIIWIATNGGLVKYDQNNGEKTFFNRGNAPIPSNQITSLEIDNTGNIWISDGAYYNTSQGISIYDGNEWTVVDSIMGILRKANNGDMLIAGQNALYRYDGEIFHSTPIPQSCALPTSIQENPTNGDIWITAYDYGCFSTIKINSAGTVFEPFNHQNTSLPFESPAHNSLFIDEEGLVWIGTSSGIFTYDGTDWVNYNNENSGIPTGTVTSIQKDDSGTLWAGIDTYFPNGTIEQGLASFDGISWTFHLLPEEYKFSNRVNVILPKGDKILIGTQNGFFEYNQTSFHRKATSNSPLLSNYVNSILHDGEDTWIGLGLGWGERSKSAVKINGDEWDTYHSGNSIFEADKSIVFMDIDHEGNIFARNGDSLYFYNGTTWQLSPLPDLVEGVDESNSFIKFDRVGNPWLFNYNGYIFQNQGNDWIIHEPQDHGNVSGNFLSILFDINNELWFGGYNGLTYYDGSTWTTFTNFAVSNNDNVYNIDVDEQNNIWLAIHNGISQFDGTTFTNFTWEEIGLPKRARFTAIEIDSEGHIWAGGLNFLVEYDGDQWEIYDTKGIGLPRGNVNILKEDNHNNMWIGVDANGFSIFNKDGIQGGTGIHTATNSPNPILPLHLYPTLASKNSNITIQFPQDIKESTANLLIHNQEGKLLYSEKVSMLQQKDSINLSKTNISSGTYFISLIVKDKRYIGKIVVN